MSYPTLDCGNNLDCGCGTGASPQHGTATLVPSGGAGVASVTVTMDHNGDPLVFAVGMVILLSYNTVGGSADYISAPVASRDFVGNTFVIFAANPFDDSTVDWVICK